MKYPFPLGAEVRLNRGWTRMIVIGYMANGDLIAKYDHGTFRDWARVTLKDYDEPEHAHATQIRKPSGFTPWDGTPAERKHPMPKLRYRTINKSASDQVLKGTYLNTTSKGEIVLELDAGYVNTYHPDQVEEDVEFTFDVKSVANNYRCSYTAPEMSGTIQPGDLLFSATGNLYAVTAINTANRNPKGIFQGVRLVTAPF